MFNVDAGITYVFSGKNTNVNDSTIKFQKNYLALNVKSR